MALQVLSHLVILALSVGTMWLTVSAQRGTPAPERLSSAGSPVAARNPYTVVLEESTHGPSADVSQGTMTIALRGDGAVALRFEHFVGTAVIQRTLELPDGVTVVLDDVRERRTTRHTRSGLSFRARMDPTRGCVHNDWGELVFPGQIVSDPDFIAGYETIKVTSDHSTVWFPPQLGCATVKSITRQGGGGTNEKVATRIVPGEPDGALFAVMGYQEVRPSVFFEMDPDSDAARKMDAVYFRNRPRQ
jgi:hypothetical protein